MGQVSLSTLEWTVLFKKSLMKIYSHLFHLECVMTFETICSSVVKVEPRLTSFTCDAYAQKIYLSVRIKTFTGKEFIKFSTKFLLFPFFVAY